MGHHKVDQYMHYGSHGRRIEKERAIKLIQINDGQKIINSAEENGHSDAGSPTDPK